MKIVFYGIVLGVVKLLELSLAIVQISLFFIPFALAFYLSLTR